MLDDYFGRHRYGVRFPDGTTFQESSCELEPKQEVRKKKVVVKRKDVYSEPMLTILIPAAGNGQRFRDAGYDIAKPLIKVKGEMMVGSVLKNVKPDMTPSSSMIITRAEHKVAEAFLMDPQSLLPNVIIELDKPTAGSVDTLLKAAGKINGAPLLLANCDQLASFDVEDFIKGDASILTFKSENPGHSYVSMDHEGYLNQIVEKQVITHDAVVGIYYFKDSDRFFEACRYVMDNDIKVKGEYYVSTVIARLIATGLKIRAVEADKAIMLGTPEQLDEYLKEKAS